MSESSIRQTVRELDGIAERALLQLADQKEANRQKTELIANMADENVMLLAFADRQFRLRAIAEREIAAIREGELEEVGRLRRERQRILFGEARNRGTDW
jgi:hypothetical protein